MRFAFSSTPAADAPAKAAAAAATAPPTGADTIKAGWPTPDAPAPSPPSLNRTLTALQAELARLQRQQSVLEAAVADHAAVVAVPRPPPLDLTGALAPVPPPDAAPPRRRAKPKAPGVSGGMTGLPVAEDLLLIDFSSPADAPPEFRAAPYDAPVAAAADGGPLARAPSGVVAADDVGDVLQTVLAQQKLILRLLADAEGGREGVAAGAIARLREDGVLGGP